MKHVNPWDECRASADHTHTAFMTGGTCSDCGKPWNKGDSLVRVGLGKFIHWVCPK